MVRHDLPRLQYPVRILRIKRSQPLVHEICCKALGARRRGGQHEHPVPLLLIVVQILHQLCKAIIIGRDISGIDREPVGKPDTKSLEFHGREREETLILKLCHRLLHGVEHIHLSGQDISLFRPVCHALPKLEFHSARMFLDAQRLVEIDTAPPVP